MSEPSRRDLEAIRRAWPAEARTLVVSGDTVLIDTRHRSYHDEAHAVGAQSAPFTDIRRSPDESMLGRDPSDPALILYRT